MCICLSVCLSVCLCICVCLSVHVCICIIMCLTMCAYPCVCMYVCLSLHVCVCVCLTMCACVSVHVRVCMCVCLSVCLSVHVSVCLTMCTMCVGPRRGVHQVPEERGGACSKTTRCCQGKVTRRHSHYFPSARQCSCPYSTHTHLLTHSLTHSLPWLWTSSLCQLAYSLVSHGMAPSNQHSWGECVAFFL